MAKWSEARMAKANSNTGSDVTGLNTALGGISESFRRRIIQSYVDLKHRGRVGDAKGAASSHTHFCESLLRFLQEDLTGHHIPAGTHIKDFQQECAKLANAPATPINESQRLIIPRGLAFLHTIRNKRGTGHVGGDVDANTIDLATVVRIADWIVCELIRLYHHLSLEEAQDLLDKIVTRQIPDVWSYGDTKRVLRTGLKAKEQTMLLLYGEISPVPIETLHSWQEYSTLSTFRKDIIRPLHKSRIIECDPETDMIILTPAGDTYVETKLLCSALTPQ
jgi:hypothetical protein